MEGDKPSQFKVEDFYPALKTNPRPIQGYSCPSRESMADLVCSYFQTKAKGNPLITQQYALLADEIIWRHKGDDEAAEFFHFLRHQLEVGNQLESIDDQLKK